MLALAIVGLSLIYKYEPEAPQYEPGSGILSLGSSPGILTHQSSTTQRGLPLQYLEIKTSGHGASAKMEFKWMQLVFDLTFWFCVVSLINRFIVYTRKSKSSSGVLG